MTVCRCILDGHDAEAAWLSAGSTAAVPSDPRLLAVDLVLTWEVPRAPVAGRLRCGNADNRACSPSRRNSAVQKQPTPRESDLAGGDLHARRTAWSNDAEQAPPPPMELD